MKEKKKLNRSVNPVSTLNSSVVFFSDLKKQNVGGDFVAARSHVFSIF